MKRISCVLIIILISVNLVIGQGRVGASVRRSLHVSKFAEAEKAWIPFWERFTRTIRNHDGKFFKELISKDYECHCNCVSSADKRDTFFCLFGSTDINWREHFIWILDKKTEIRKINSDEGNIVRTVSSDKSREHGNDAVFNYEKDGNWYFWGSSGWGM